MKSVVSAATFPAADSIAGANIIPTGANIHTTTSIPTVTIAGANMSTANSIAGLANPAVTSIASATGANMPAVTSIAGAAIPARTTTTATPVASAVKSAKRIGKCVIKGVGKGLKICGKAVWKSMKREFFGIPEKEKYYTREEMLRKLDRESRRIYHPPHHGLRDAEFVVRMYLAQKDY